MNEESGLRVGVAYNIIWEDRYGVVQSGRIIVIDSDAEIVHCIFGEKPHRIPRDHIWSCKEVDNVTR